MSQMSSLLGQVINSIIDVKEESDLDSFLAGNNVSFSANEIKGLDDFEQICFLVIKDSEEVSNKKNYRLVGAPNKYNPNQIFRIGKGFGLFVYFTRYEQTYFANGWEIRPESKPRGPRKKKPQ